MLIVAVVVPVEPGTALPPHLGEELALHPIEQIEADEGIMVHLRIELYLVVLQTLHHAAIERALVGLALLRQAFVELHVEGFHDAPELLVLFAKLPPAAGVELLEETLQHLLLAFSQIVHLLDFLDVCHVLKESIGIDHVLIHIFKVVKYALCPPVEPIDGDGLLRELLKKLDDDERGINAVGHGEVGGKVGKEFADGGIAWCPERALACEVEEIFIDIESGTLTGEDDERPAQVALRLTEKVGGYVLQEGSHK